MFIITIISWSGALLVAWLLRSTIIRGESTPFVMELPPYRVPTLKGLLIHTFERVYQYIKKAGTVILGISIVLWAMMTFPGLNDTRIAEFDNQRDVLISELPETIQTGLMDMENDQLTEEAKIIKNKLVQLDIDQAREELKNSFAGKIGVATEVITQYAGFDWQTNIALIGGFAAKEVVVSTLGTAYSLGELDQEETLSLAEKLRSYKNWGPLTGFSLILFTIFYAPCFVTVVCIARETGSWKWAAFSVMFNTCLALVVSTLFYQIGKAVI